MDPRKLPPIGAAVVLAAFGFLVASLGSSVARRWSGISAAYAACGLLWIVAGPVMIAAGFWQLIAFGRLRLPLWIGGGAAFLAGAVLVTGVLTYVVPCSGPS